MCRDRNYELVAVTISAQKYAEKAVEIAGLVVHGARYSPDRMITFFTRRAFLAELHRILGAS